MSLLYTYKTLAEYLGLKHYRIVCNWVSLGVGPVPPMSAAVCVSRPKRWPSGSPAARLRRPSAAVAALLGKRESPRLTPGAWRRSGKTDYSK